MVRTNMHLSSYKFHPPDKRLQIGICTGIQRQSGSGFWVADVL